MEPLLEIGLLMSPEEKIVQACANYLGIEDIDSKKHHVSAMRRLSVILIDDLIRPKPQKKAIAIAIRSSPGIVSYSRGFKSLYYGDSKIYHFMYENVRAKIEGREHFTLSDFYVTAVSRFPDRSIMFFTAKPFAMYFVRQSMSSAETVSLLGLPEECSPPAFELEEKDLYLSIIDQTITEMIEKIKPIEK